MKPELRPEMIRGCDAAIDKLDHIIERTNDKRARARLVRQRGKYRRYSMRFREQERKAGRDA